MFRVTETMRLFHMAGGKIPSYIEQAADTEAMAAATHQANAYPPQEVTVAHLGERLALLEQRVLELEMNRPTFSG